MVIAEITNFTKNCPKIIDHTNPKAILIKINESKKDETKLDLNALRTQDFAGNI